MKIQALDAELKKDLEHLNQFIYNNPETGYEEFLSCAAHISLLEKYGFTVEKNYMGMATAYRAEYTGGKPGPWVSYLAEYDALPEMGHGCGHNLLGAVSVGAAVLLSRFINTIGGGVVVFGCPAEETSGAKVALAKGGAFERIDAALIAHPANRYEKSGSSLAIDAVQFVFKGKSAHAAAAPEQGINALDACIATFHSVGALRQHILPSARIHGIITEGGIAANIIPDRAVAQFYVRTTEKAYLKELSRKVEACARAGALASGAEVEISRFELGYDNTRTNNALSEALTNNLELLGVGDISEPGPAAGSTDVGNVSHVCPTVQFYFNICAPGESFPTHTAAFRDATLRQPALDALDLNARALAMTGADIIINQSLLKRMKEEFISADS